MFEGIKEGLELEATKQVVPTDSAKQYGSGMVDVFSTPALVALCESTSMKLISKYLPAGFTSVGYEVNIKHIKATLIGGTVKCIAKIKEVDSRKLTFELTAWDEDALIGEGTHIRYIVDERKFLEKLNLKKKD